MVNDKKGKFGLGLLIGTVIGGLTAFFLSPKSGSENREEVAKKIKLLTKKLEEAKDEIPDEIRTVYTEAKRLLIDGLAELKETVENIDKEKYMAVVEDVMKKVQKEAKKDAKQLDKLKKQLIKEWGNLQN